MPPIIIDHPPDTVIVTSRPDTITFVATKRINVAVHDTTILVDTVSVPALVVQDPPGFYISFKEFKISKYVTSSVWAYARSPADSLRNKVIVNWADYDEEIVLPKYEQALKDEQFNGLWKGAAAVTLFGLGLATGDYKYALGGAVSGGLIIVIF